MKDGCEFGEVARIGSQPAKKAPGRKMFAMKAYNMWHQTISAGHKSSELTLSVFKKDQDSSFLAYLCYTRFPESVGSW